MIRPVLVAAAALVLAVPASGAVRALPPTDPCGAMPTCVLVTVAHGSYKDRTGGARITSSPAGIDCRFVDGGPDGKSTCQAIFRSIQSFVVVTLTVTPDPGTEIRSGCTAASPALPCTTTFDAVGYCPTDLFCSRHAVSLRFAGLTLSVTKSGDGSGTVTSDPPGIACGATCTAAGLALQAAVTLTARPDAGGVFKTWTGACAGQQATCKLTLAKDTSTNAVFTLPSAPSTTTTKSPPPPPPPPPTTTSSPPPPPPVVVKPAAAKLTARLAGLRVVTQGRVRSLQMTVRVSARGRAQVQLLQQGFERAQRIVALHAGANVVQLPLPARVKPGSYRVAFTVRAGSRSATTTALVTVKTRGG